MNEPLSSQVMQTYRRTLGVNSSPSSIDSSMPPQPVAIIQTPTPEILFADASHAGASTSTILTGSGNGQMIVGFVLSAETSTSGNFQLAIQSKNVVNAKIALNTTETIVMSLDRPFFVPRGATVTMTTSNAGFNIAGCVHYYNA